MLINIKWCIILRCKVKSRFSKMSVVHSAFIDSWGFTCKLSQKRFLTFFYSCFCGNTPFKIYVGYLCKHNYTSRVYNGSLSTIF